MKNIFLIALSKQSLDCLSMTKIHLFTFYLWNTGLETEIEISKLKLDQKGLERIPSYGAENDIVGAFSVTPGVITTGDQGGQLYVRGGTPIQNKVLLDGMTIYNPFHSIGYFSIFETELVKNVDIYTGGFESKYGGRISSVMDITYRDGNRKEFGYQTFYIGRQLNGPDSRPFN